MTIMTRFVRLVKADVHGVMDQLEDKGLLLRQYLREMEASIGQKQAQLDALSERADRMKTRMAHHTTEMNKLDQDVDLALRKEKEDLARMLIRRFRDLEMAVSRLQEEIDATSKERTRLAQTVMDQKLQYETLQTRAEVWCSRSAEEPFTSAARSFPSDGDPHAISDEEIELVLIQRKAALSEKGGGA